uniref:Uncharacterized protein n=1 Tax=Meloidogyne enterolobii TaxID=390850 RepID=A0A6V7U658_MELEN|nr:unnamed protein product [Meloidogyne enterolobii]
MCLLSITPEVGRNSQRCRKSELPEIGNGSKVGTRKSEIKIFFSEIGNRKGKNAGNRKSEGGNRK